MKKQQSALTIGNFDGVHKGHIMLIKETLSIAEKNKYKSIIIAFEKPVKNNTQLLSLADEKIELLKSFNPDEIIILPSDSSVFSQEAQNFFDEFLIKRCKMAAIICGKDFAFGKNRKGDINWLKNKTKENNILLKALNPLKSNGKKISSTLIRKFIETNKIEKANFLLGRPYNIEGIHFREKGIASKMGFPTINLKTDASKLLPKGVFISLVYDKNKTYPSITNIGYRPTISSEKEISIETHILNFKGVWKKKKAKISLLKHIRNEKKFKNLADLTNQIKKDVQKAEFYFKRNKRQK
jgi:riboflavin kinase/FMN adenylyltransferase